VEAGKKHVPSPRKLLCSLPGFVLTYQAPFVEVSSESPSQISPEILEGRGPTIFVPVGPRVRLVHHSVQDYLLSVCRADNAGSPSSHLSINLQDGHEEIAHVCSSYLRCDQLRLGWIDLENRNSDGMQIMTRLRLIFAKDWRLILYSSTLQNSAYTIFINAGSLLGPVDWPNLRIRNKITSTTLSIFLRLSRAGYECAAQVRQLKLNRDHDIYFGPSHGGNALD
jgi:hypothetical protein